MSEVRRWLDSLGLGQYADAFEENAIGADQIATLTDEELKELGVQALGHRKRIRTAICKLGEAPATFAPAPRAAPSEQLSPRAFRAAPRRARW